MVGEAAALAALVHLGEEYTVPCSESYSWCVDGQETRTGYLHLAGSGVHGPVAALRALPGLGADWGPEDRSWYGGHQNRRYDFTPCSAFGGQQPSGGNDYTWGTGSPGCGAAGLAVVAVSPKTSLCRNARTRYGRSKKMNVLNAGCSGCRRS